MGAIRNPIKGDQSLPLVTQALILNERGRFVPTTPPLERCTHPNATIQGKTAHCPDCNQTYLERSKVYKQVLSRPPVVKTASDGINNDVLGEFQRGDLVQGESELQEGMILQGCVLGVGLKRVQIRISEGWHTLKIETARLIKSDAWDECCPECEKPLAFPGNGWLDCNGKDGCGWSEKIEVCLKPAPMQLEPIEEVIEEEKPPLEQSDIEEEIGNWLMGCPPNDINFKVKLKSANLATIEHCLSVMRGQPEGNKGRIKALERQAKDLRFAEVHKASVKDFLNTLAKRPLEHEAVEVLEVQAPLEQSVKTYSHIQALCFLPFLSFPRIELSIGQRVRDRRSSSVNQGYGMIVGFTSNGFLPACPGLKYFDVPEIVLLIDWDNGKKGYEIFVGQVELASINDQAEISHDAIALLETQQRHLKNEGEIAPAACWLERAKCSKRQCYQVFYRSNQPIFEPSRKRDPGNTQKVKRKYIGMAGSPEVKEAEAAIARRNELERLNKQIKILEEE